MYVCIVSRVGQDLADLVRVDGIGGGGAALQGPGGASGDSAEAIHLAAARGMNLALAAFQGLIRHLGLLGDPSKHRTFSLNIGE